MTFRWGWLVPAALAALLIHRLACDTFLPHLCDTTYIWEGYEDVPLGGDQRYRLIKFKDGDARLSQGGCGPGGALIEQLACACRSSFPQASCPLQTLLEPPARHACAVPHHACLALLTVPSVMHLLQNSRSCSSASTCPSYSCTVTWARTSRFAQLPQRRGGS